MGTNPEARFGVDRDQATEREKASRVPQKGEQE